MSDIRYTDVRYTEENKDILSQIPVALALTSSCWVAIDAISDSSAKICLQQRALGENSRNFNFVRRCYLDRDISGSLSRLL